MRRIVAACTLCLVTLSTFIAQGEDQDVEALIVEARQLASQDKLDDALQRLDQAIKLDPRSGIAYHLRGVVRSRRAEPRESVADFTRAIEHQTPGLAAAYDARGSEQFKLADFAASIADFDKFIELVPEQEPHHWKRGISYYYAARYDDGRRQFEGYQTVDDSDVENAVWRYLCMARDPRRGAEEARRDLLKIKLDRRVPMMEVYALFAGQATPDDVMRAVEQGDPPPRELHQRRFYAHLYLGLYHDVAGRRDEGLDHLRRAARDYPIDHYMADVARVHWRLLEPVTKP